MKLSCWFRVATLATVSCLTTVGFAATFSLIGSNAPARILVPADGSLGSSWITTGFDDSAWNNATNGLGFQLAGTVEGTNGYGGLIHTDLGSAMLGTNDIGLRSSAYIRFCFNVTNAAALGQLRLQMNYDDGFVAYLNGVEVARRNASTNAGWNSAATVERTRAQGITPETIGLTGFLDLLQTGGNVLAIHGFNARTNDNDFLILAQLEGGPADNVAAVTITNRGIDQVGPEVLQLWVETEGPPYPGMGPNDFVQYVWQIEALDGSPPYPTNSDPQFAIRFEVKNIPDLCGGFVTTLKQQPQQQFRIPAFVDGTRVMVRVTLSQIGRPSRFRWNCSASASGVAAPPATDLQEYQVQHPMLGEDQVARVVIQPALILRGGVIETTPWILAHNTDGVPLSLDGRNVKLYAYSDRLRIASRNIRAIPGTAGAAGVTAHVDGVLSCNVAWAMTGSLEMHPAVLHLDLASHPSDSFSLVGNDAAGGAVSLDSGFTATFTDLPDYCTISNQSSVQMLDQSNLPYKPHAVINTMHDHYWPANTCLTRFVCFPSPLMPVVERRGEHVSFWCSPLATNPVPELFQFHEMAERYGLTRTLDQGYLLAWQLAGVLAFKSGRQHYAVVCNDARYQLCGGNGNPIAVGFDPREFTSCVFEAVWPGSPPAAQVVGPNFVAMLHELGHNCLSVSKSLLQTLLCSQLGTDPFYNEAFATLFAHYGRQQILKTPGRFDVNTSLLESFTRADWPTSVSFRRHYFVDVRLGEYLVKGAHYPGDLNADVMEGILILLGERYGWDMYRRFFSIFYPPDEPWDFTPQDETERATFFIAAISAAAKEDTRSVFRGWGFPCDETLYERLLPDLTWRAAQRDSVAQMEGMQFMPRLKITTIQSTSQDLLLLRAEGVSATRCILQFSEDQSHWLNVDTNAPFAGSWNFEMERPPGSCGFYRAVIE